MAVTVTPAAAKHISNHIASRGKGLGIRVAVRTSGCSGMAYVLEFVDQVAAEDHIFDVIDDIKVVVDPKSMAYLDGTELDFVKEGLNEGFKFNNPNASAECGCGESFTV